MPMLHVKKDLRLEEVPPGLAFGAPAVFLKSHPVEVTEGEAVILLDEFPGNFSWDDEGNENAARAQKERVLDLKAHRAALKETEK